MCCFGTDILAELAHVSLPGNMLTGDLLIVYKMYVDELLSYFHSVNYVQYGTVVNILLLKSKHNIIFIEYLLYDLLLIL